MLLHDLARLVQASAGHSLPITAVPPLQLGMQQQQEACQHRLTLGPGLAEVPWRHNQQQQQAQVQAGNSQSGSTHSSRPQRSSSSPHSSSNSRYSSHRTRA